MKRLLLISLLSVSISQLLATPYIVPQTAAEYKALALQRAAKQSQRFAQRAMCTESTLADTLLNKFNTTFTSACEGLTAQSVSFGGFLSQGKNILSNLWHEPAATGTKLFELVCQNKGNTAVLAVVTLVVGYGICKLFAKKKPAPSTTQPALPKQGPSSGS